MLLITENFEESKYRVSKLITQNDESRERGKLFRTLLPTGKIDKVIEETNKGEVRTDNNVGLRFHITEPPDTLVPEGISIALRYENQKELYVRIKTEIKN